MKDKNNKNSQHSNEKEGNKKMSLTTSADAEFVFIYKKTEKIVTAAYMVTDFFSDNEPLKWKIRKESTEILSLIRQLKHATSSGHDSVFYTIQSQTEEINSLLEICFGIGYISEMNYSIINREFTQLVEVIIRWKQNNHTPKGQDFFSPQFFKVSSGEQPSEVSADPISQEQIPSLDKGSDEEKKQTSSPSENPPFSFSESSQIESQRPSFSSKPKRYSTSKVKVKRNKRKNNIINFLKKKDRASIKDISRNVNGCSEKTIQRELSVLIEDGVLKKEGERRWSRYSLV